MIQIASSPGVNVRNVGKVVGKDARIQAWDRLRGLAILLMVLDHLAVFGFFGSSAPVVGMRLTITRLALPIFMMVAGSLWAVRGPGPNWYRLANCVVGGLVAFVCWSSIGLPHVDILIVFAAVALYAAVIVRWPVVCLVAGILQTINLPVMSPGYELGYVAAWLALGVLVGDRPSWRSLGDSLPAWLASIGRRPLLWYTSHLVVLAVVHTCLRN